MKLNAELTLLNSEDFTDIYFNVKISYFESSNEKETLIPKKIFSNFLIYEENILPVKKINFEFNDEPYYEPIEYGFVKIDTEHNDIALAIIAHRSYLFLNVPKEKNKKLKDGFAVSLNNCGVYELNNKSVIVKPNDVDFMDEMDIQPENEGQTRKKIKEIEEEISDIESSKINEINEEI